MNFNYKSAIISLAATLATTKREHDYSTKILPSIFDFKGDIIMKYTHLFCPKVQKFIAHNR